MKQWICAFAVCGCSLLGVQAAGRTPSRAASEGAATQFQEAAASPAAVGLGGPALALIQGAGILSASWGEIQGGCLVPETGAFGSLLFFVRGAAIRAQAAHEKEALLRMFSLVVLMMLLGLTAAICLDPAPRRFADGPR